MGVLTQATPDRKRAHQFHQLFTYSGFAVYCAVVTAATLHHEPWADEAQSWLLARDAGLPELWTKLLHYEGSPGLWQSLLHILIKLGLPYTGLHAVAGLLGAASAGLWMWRTPMPAALRITVPFTFFLGYQYAVIARSYSLLPLLVFGCAAVYGTARQHPWRLSLLLSLLAATSAHGMALSVAIWIAFVVAQWREGTFSVRGLMWPSLTYLVIVIFSAFAAWPARDAVFVTRWNLSLEHLGQVSLKSMGEALTGNWPCSAVVLGLSIPFLWRGGGLLMFALSSALLCGLASLIYSQVWHQGIIVLAWLCAMWIAAGRTKMTKPAIAAMAIMIAFQCYWTVRSIGYDWTHEYSGSASAARYLRESRITESGIYAIGYACTAIQPYFRANIFANEHDGNGPAYWDWSSANHVNEDSGRLMLKRPPYVIVGYKGSFEQGFWTDAVLRSGYLPVRHFEGNVYWRTRVLEPESYDLYRRGDVAVPALPR